MVDVELMTLGFLMSGPKTGYRLKSIAGKMMLFYNISLNQNYPTLRKLEEAGYVEKKIVIQTGKPNKNVYSLTHSGKDHFMEKITDPPEPIEYRLPFLIRVFFYRFLEDEQKLIEFEKEIQSIDEQLAALERMGPNVETQADEEGKFGWDTAVFFLSALRDWYQQELERRKRRYKSRRNRKRS